MLTTTFHPLKKMREQYSNQEIVSELFARKDKGLISVQENGRFLSFCYTKECQFNKEWDDFTRIARGLIFDTRLQVFHCTLAKFMNYGELSEEERPKGEIVEVSNKYDGSLIILYFDIEEGEWRTATKGSFKSDQAYWAQKWFNEKPIDLNPYVTYLCEAIYEENQIVVKYDWTGMVFLAAYRNNGFDEINLEEHFNDIPLYGRYKLRETFDIRNLNDVDPMLQQKNFEGVVVKYTCGTRVKFKSDEYCALHKLVTGVTRRRVWELLYNEMTSNPGDMKISEWKRNVPEEFWPEVDEWANEYIRTISCSIGGAAMIFDKIKDLPTRKEFALVASRYDGLTKSLLFMMLDNKTSNLELKVMEMMRP